MAFLNQGWPRQALGRHVARTPCTHAHGIRHRLAKALRARERGVTPWHGARSPWPDPAVARFRPCHYGSVEEDRGASRGSPSKGTRAALGDEGEHPGSHRWCPASPPSPRPGQEVLAAVSGNSGHLARRGGAVEPCLDPAHPIAPSGEGKRPCLLSFLGAEVPPELRRVPTPWSGSAVPFCRRRRAVWYPDESN